jgi:hypothetical protein
MMGGELMPGDRCDQMNGKTLVRVVRIVNVGEDESLVEACFGPLRGHRYFVPNTALERIKRGRE